MSDASSEQFEQLLNDALDAPADAVLQQRIADLVGCDPARTRLAGEWRRLDEILRRQGATVQRRVDWTAFSAAIRAALEREMSAADARLDDALRASTGQDDSVDWVRMRDRITAGAESAGGYRRRLTLTPRIVRFGLTFAAAAAALLVVSYLTPARPGARSDAEQVAILVAGPAAALPGSPEFLDVVVSAPADAGDAPLIAAAGEMFLMIDPPPAGGTFAGEVPSTDLQ